MCSTQPTKMIKMIYKTRTWNEVIRADRETSTRERIPLYLSLFSLFVESFLLVCHSLLIRHSHHFVFLCSCSSSRESSSCERVCGFSFKFSFLCEGGTRQGNIQVYSLHTPCSLMCLASLPRQACMRPITRNVCRKPFKDNCNLESVVLPK